MAFLFSGFVLSNMLVESAEYSNNGRYLNMLLF